VSPPPLPLLRHNPVSVPHRLSKWHLDAISKRNRRHQPPVYPIKRKRRKPHQSKSSCCQNSAAINESHSCSSDSVTCFMFLICSKFTYCRAYILSKCLHLFIVSCYTLFYFYAKKIISFIIRVESFEANTPLLFLSKLFHIIYRIMYLIW
jgi:hypothetical protein